MNRLLSKTVKDGGSELLNDPFALSQALVRAGMTKIEAARYELVLNACPGLLNTVEQAKQRGSLGCAEVQSLLSTICRASGLTPNTAEECLYDLLVACDAPLTRSFLCGLRFAPAKQCKQLGIEQDQESKLLQHAKTGLQDEQTEALALHDLSGLSEKGSFVASYTCGVYFWDKKQYKIASGYFQRSAAQGYGPGNAAYGAALLQRSALFAGAADHACCHPNAYSGREGKDWLQTGQKLLRYRIINKRRIGVSFLLCAAALLLALFVLQLSPVLGAFCIALSMLALGWNMFALMYSRCTTLVPTWCLLFLSWILALLSLL